MATETVSVADVEAKRRELADRLGAVRRELDRLSRLALHLQGAIAGLDELLPAPDISEVLPEGMELDNGTE